MSVHGFSNSTLYATNVDFRGVTPVVDQMTADGQLLIGSSVAPFIRSGLLTSTGATVAITVGHGTINLETTGGVTSIVGDSGTSVSGAVTLTTGNSTRNCGSSVQFVSGTTTITLDVMDLNNNLYLGLDAGNASDTGQNNVGIGYQAMMASGSSAYCVAVGYGALSTCTGASSLVAIGLEAMYSAQNNSDCVAVGTGALYSSAHGIQNTALGSGCLNKLNNAFSANNNTGSGYNCFPNITGGSRNFGAGATTGSAYTGTESDNILINSAGVVSESNTLRLGQATGTGNYQLNKAYIQGIANATISAGSPTPYLALVDTSDGQVVCPTPVAANTASSTFGSLAVGTALQNTANYPILVNVSMVMSAATGAVILVGVGSTNAPTAQAVTAAFSGAATESFSFVVPAKFYAKVTTTGTITVTSTTTLATQIG